MNQWSNKIREWFRPTPSEYSASLHIGNSCVVLLEFEINKEQVILLSVAQHRRVAQQTDEEIIKKIFNDNRLLGKNLSIALSSDSGIARIINYPMMDEKQLRDSLSFQAEKYLPYAISDIYFDCQPIYIQTPKMASKQIKVLLVASKREAIAKSMELVKRSSYQLDVVNLAPIATINAFLSFLSKEDKKQTQILLDVGSKITHFSFFEEGNLSFIRDISYGTIDLMESLSKQLNISKSDAEKFLTEDVTEYDDNSKNILRKAIDKIMNEVQLTMDYLEEQRERPLSTKNMYIAGGISQNALFVEAFEKNFSVSLKSWDPLKGVIVNPVINDEDLKLIKGVLPSAVGLALAK